MSAATEEDESSLLDIEDVLIKENEYVKDIEVAASASKLKHARRAKIWQCVVCLEILTSRKNLEDHVKTDHPNAEQHSIGAGVSENGSLKCMFCDQFCQNDIDVLSHAAEAHDDLADLECQDCERQFQKAVQLQKHSRIHSNFRPYKCSQCNKAFPWPEHLNVHLRTLHMENKNEKWVCLKCNKTFSANSALRKHERLHSGDVRYTCSVCGMGFPVSEPYKIHLRKHYDMKPFECGQCGKKFGSRAACRRHTMHHLDIRPYQCSECGKSFKQKQTFERHNLTHQNFKPFSCSLCAMGLSTKFNLKQHWQKVHRREMPDCELERVSKIGKSANAISVIDLDGDQTSADSSDHYCGRLRAFIQPPPVNLTALVPNAASAPQTSNSLQSLAVTPLPTISAPLAINQMQLGTGMMPTEITAPQATIVSSAHVVASAPPIFMLPRGDAYILLTGTSAPSSKSDLTATPSISYVPVATAACAREPGDFLPAETSVQISVAAPSGYVMVNSAVAEPKFQSLVPTAETARNDLNISATEIPHSDSHGSISQALAMPDLTSPGGSTCSFSNLNDLLLLNTPVKDSKI